MPRIPQYIAQMSPTTQSGIRIDPATQALSGKMIEKVGQAITEANEKFTDLRNLQEYTSASTQLKSAMMELQQNASKDQDVYTIVQRSTDTSRKIRDKALNSISDPATRQRFNVEHDFLIQSKLFDIRNTVRGREIDKAQATLLTDIDQSKRDYYEAGSPLERKQMLDQINFRLTEYARLGAINEEEAAAKKIAIRDELRKGEVLYDITLDPKMALDNLNNNIYDLNPAEKKEFEEEANSALNKVQKEQKLQLELEMQQNEVDLYNRVINGQASLIDIEDAKSKGLVGLPGGVSKEVADNLRDRLIGKMPEPSAGEQANTFNELQDQFVNLDIDVKNDETKSTAEQLADFRKKVIEAMSEKKIDKTDGQEWLRNTSVVFDDKLTEEVKKRNHKSGWNVLKYWAEGKLFKVLTSGMKQTSDEELSQLKAELGKKLMSRVSKGEDSVEAANKIIEEKQKEMNPNRARYQVGDVIDTPAGSVKVVGFYPDGEPDVELINK